MAHDCDVLVVGAGIIGCAIARETAIAGLFSKSYLNRLNPIPWCKRSQPYLIAIRDADTAHSGDRCGFSAVSVILLIVQ